MTAFVWAPSKRKKGKRRREKAKLGFPTVTRLTEMAEGMGEPGRSLVTDLHRGKRESMHTR